MKQSAATTFTVDNAIKAANVGGNVASVVIGLVVLLVVIAVASAIIAPKTFFEYFDKLPECAQNIAVWTMLIVGGIVGCFILVAIVVSLGSKSGGSLLI